MALQETGSDPGVSLREAQQPWLTLSPVRQQSLCGHGQLPVAESKGPGHCPAGEPLPRDTGVGGLGLCPWPAARSAAARSLPAQDLIKVHHSFLRAIDVSMMAGGGTLAKVFLDFKER